MARPDRSGWWTYTKNGRYRLTKAGSNGLASIGVTQRPGTFVSEKTLVNVRDTWIKARGPVVRDLAAQLKAGNISISEWVLEMRTELKTVHGAQFVLGRGGLGNMTQSDWGKLGANLRQQYGYLNDFANQTIANPQWSEGRIAARAQMYLEASSASFEQGRSRGVGTPSLPQYPGDGNTQCLTNCKCYWRIVSKATEWHCYWTLQAAEHCPDCVENAGKWNPLILPKINLKVLKNYLQGLMDVHHNQHAEAELQRA